MRITRPDDASIGFKALSGVACLLAIPVMAGCAHHRADQYAYAPPYAPAVYPQPPAPALPAAYAAAAPGMPPAAPPTATLPPGAVVATAPAAGGMVVPAVGGECPPCTTGADGVVMPATLVEGGGQTPPCPPGP